MREFVEGGGFDAEREHWQQAARDDPTPVLVTLDTDDTEAWVWRQRDIRVTMLCAVALNPFFSGFYAA